MLTPATVRYDNPLPDMSRVAIPAVTNQSSAAGLRSGMGFADGIQRILQRSAAPRESVVPEDSFAAEAVQPEAQTPGDSLRRERQRLARKVRNTLDKVPAPLPEMPAELPVSAPETYSTPALDPPLPGEEVSLFPTDGQDDLLLSIPPPPL